MDVMKPFLLAIVALALALGSGGMIPGPDEAAASDSTASGGAAGGGPPLPPPAILGDVNCDAEIDSIDAALVLQVSAGIVDTLDCHDAADVNADGETNSVDAALILQYVAGLIEGFGGEVQPSTFDVDGSVQPAMDEIPGIDGGPPRPLASMTDANDNQADYVANELLVLTADPAEVTSLLERWGGDLLQTVDPHSSIVTEATAAGFEGPIPSAYLIRIDPAAVDTSGLAGDLQAIDPGVRSDLRFSGEDGLGVFAAAASESAGGLTVGLNMVLPGDDYDERVTTEAASATDRSGDYSTNAFEWPYMRRHLLGTTIGVQDIGVGEAWRALELTGRLNNHSKVVVFDGGFAPNPDFPPGSLSIGGLRTQNPDSSTDAWHGTHVVTAGFGRPDNNFGGAGPGGPVTDLVVVQSPASSFWQMIKFIFADVPTALAQGPDIINISASIRIPAVACLFACEAIDIASSIIRAAGTLIFASAGNDGRDVDRRDCAWPFDWPCWEEAGWMPCEADYVICVGGLDWNRLYAHRNSNIGRPGDCCTVDIYGPYEVWVTPQPASDGTVPAGAAQTMTGTSFSSPFVAGVAALIWAANPGLSAGQVENILISSAHKDWNPGLYEHNPRIRVNAYGAVVQALGNAPPDLTMTYPPRGAVYPKGAPVEFFAPASDPEDGTPTVTWTSSIDGTIGSGTSLFTRNDLSLGTHTITARATDSGGFTDAETATITIRNDPPVVNITQPASGSKFVAGEFILFRATSYDSSDGPGSLSDGQMSWSSSVHGYLGIGHQLSVTLGQGTHTITVRGTDSQGSFDEDSITVTVNPPPPDLPPLVQITSPANNVAIHPEADPVTGDWYIDVTLAGTATDPEDGALTGSSLVWTDRINGGAPFLVGTGSPLTTRIAVPGCSGADHEVTLTATDSGGSSRSDTIVIRGWIC